MNLEVAWSTAWGGMFTRSSLTATAALAVLGLALQGCANPGSAVTQAVQVETPGCMRATCTLRNDRGSWQLPMTPGTVIVTTSKAPLEVSCRVDDGTGGAAGVPSSVSATTGSGAVAGGIAGGATAGAVFGAAALAIIPVLGVIVLASSVAAGAAAGQAVESQGRTLNYPALISIPMNCADAGAPVAGDTAARTPLGLGIRGLSRAETREAGLGERGAVLTMSVAAGGRAAAAGLRSGDIILAVGGLDVEDATAMEERVRALAPGAATPLRVWREGQVLDLLLAPASAVR